MNILFWKLKSKTSVKYDVNLTELECNTCKDRNVEWYNDQPGDTCLKDGCNGKYARILK